MRIEKYNHHGRDVWVRSDLKGRHGEHCLCFSCHKFSFDDKDRNCKIARANFANCVEFGITTPVWECPEYDSTICNNSC